MDDDGPARAAASLLTSRRGAAMVAAALVTLPGLAMLGLSNRADERFHPYEFGPGLLRRPWTVVTDAVDLSIRAASGFGNFRPVGRTVENANYALDEVLQQATGLPLHVVLGLVRGASLVLVAVLLALLAWRLAGRRSSSALAVACALPAFTFAYGGGSAFVVFSGMYLQTTALVVAVAMLFARPVRSGGAGVLALAAHLLLGAGVALFNELAYIAVPAAGASLLAAAHRDGAGGRELLGLPAVRRAVATATGFVATAVPVRVWLAGLCADGGCYAASDPSLSGLSAGLWVDRVRSALVTEALPNGMIASRATLVAAAGLVALAVAAAGLLLARTGVRTARARERRSVETRGPSAAVGLRIAAVGAVVVASSALLSSLSPALQEATRTVVGWRDAPVLAVGWALLVGGVGGAVVDRLVARTAGTASDGRVASVLAGLLVTLGLVGSGVAAVASVAQHFRDAGDPRLLLTERIGVELASFDDTATGDVRRCALLDEFDRAHPGRPDQLEQLRNALGPVTESRHHTDFCEEDA